MSKENLNLPKTAFSMKANLPQKEPGLIDFWDKINLYQNLRNESRGKEKFILHDGPPYANGNIHMGTALNKILKDIITKFHQMDDKDSVYVPGWDCHGLPIEWKIEEQYKKNKKNKNEVPIVEFRKECRDFANKWIKIHKDQFKRLGVIGDWENYYSTMSFDAEAQIVRELGKFLKEGSLYKGYKPVLWSTVEKTALSDAEVEYMDHTSDTIYVSFPIKKTDLKDLDGCEIVIWTTTPWTIPANKALAYNESLKYLIIEIDDDNEFKKNKVVVAKELLETFIKDCNIEKYKILKELPGKVFKGVLCKHPFFDIGYDYDVPMLEARFVTTEQGTGFVHCAPSHGPDDFNLCINNGIKALETVDDDGKYTKHIPKFEGIHIFKANPVVIEKLKETKRLLSNGKLKHSYPHSWRSKAPLVHRATQQWFISMESHGLRKLALKALDETKFYPSKGKERIKSMIETRPDWCVSRQRVWGVPLPIFISKKDNKVLIDDEVFENIAKIYEKEGSDCWFKDNFQRFLGKKYKADDFYQSKDIVEVWFDSGSTHSFVLEKRDDLKWPASMYLEGSDQHRGWFHSSLLESCGTRGRAPFDAVLTHGFVLDGQGRKMSKSVGNVVSPQDVIKQYGADILRLWVAMTDVTGDVRISDEVLKGVSESYRRLRNTIRFTIGALSDFEEKEIIKYEKLPDLEKWILHRLKEMDILLKDAVKNFTFQSFYSELHTFCSSDLSAFYFDIRKDILYCDDIKSPRRKICINLLALTLDSLLKWFAPILSFTTEEIFQILNKEKKSSIHLENFPEIPSKWENKQIFEKWEKLKAVRNVTNAAIEVKRSNKEIGSSLEADIEIYLSEQYLNLVKDINLSEFFITSYAKAKSMINDDKLFKIEGVDDIAVSVKKAQGEKCSRCWKILGNPCERCSSVLKN